MASTVTTVQDLIRLALLSVGVIGQNQNPSAADAKDALLILNGMVSMWRLQSLMAYSIQRNVFTYPSLKQSYTLGPGGDFDMPRPVKIERAGVILPGTSNDTELPVEIVDFDSWGRITVKNIASPIVEKIWPDYAFPLTNLNFWPYPNATQQLALYTWGALSSFPSLNTQLVLPDGYEGALRYNLACELAPNYGKDLPAKIEQLAIDYKAAIKTINDQLRDVLMACDAGILTRGRTFNFYTGDNS